MAISRHARTYRKRQPGIVNRIPLPSSSGSCAMSTGRQPCPKRLAASGAAARWRSRLSRDGGRGTDRRTDRIGRILSSYRLPDLPPAHRQVRRATFRLGESPTCASASP